VTLPSWKQGNTRTALLEFLDAAAEIPPYDRIAVFDNDGTMWCEKPLYVQLHFFMDALERVVTDRPELGNRPEYRAVLDRDKEAVGKLGLERVALALVDLFTGTRPDEFGTAVRRFFDKATHPGRGVPYRQMVYQPMLELLDEVRARGFTTYVVTGGGAEFVREVSAELYGISPAGVVGSKVAYEVRIEDDMPILLRTGEIFDVPNEGPGKIPHLHRQIGQRPILAVGNSPGDAEMLAYATGFDGPSLAMIVSHDDAAREYAYESVAGTFEATESIIDKAARLGWTTISMRDDWATIFPPEDR